MELAESYINNNNYYLGELPPDRNIINRQSEKLQEFIFFDKGTGTLPSSDITKDLADLGITVKKSFNNLKLLSNSISPPRSKSSSSSNFLSILFQRKTSFFLLSL